MSVEPTHILSQTIKKENGEIQMEILAPCGSPEHIEPALRAGADAVYLGLKAMSARRNAANFTPDELCAAAERCHMYGAMIYLTVNTIAFDKEGEALRDTLKAARQSRVDALIVQDLGVLAYVRESLPEMPLFASTQMAVNSARGAELCRELGISRVVLARELSKEQIARIITQTGMETEVFVHGALCGGVSGQCYLSAALGSRSGNRGLCAQPCRLDFKAGGKENVLSLKDLTLVNRLLELRDMGVSSAKIEGRMKRPEYVALSVAACRAALDGKEPDLDALGAMFSRSGFTDGYFTGVKSGMRGVRRHEDVISSQEALKTASPPESKRFALKLKVSLREGAQTVLQGSDGINSARVYGACPEKAQNREITIEAIKKQLEKLGGTPYHLGELESDVESGLNLPLSELNSLRRKLLTVLDDKRAIKQEYNFYEHEWFSSGQQKKRNNPYYRACCQTAEQANAALELGAEVSLPSKVLINNGFLGEGIIAAPPRFAQSEEETERELRVLYSRGYRKLLCSNLAHIAIGERIGFYLHGAWTLNISNSRALREIERIGLNDAELSIELPARETPDGVIPTGRVVFGNLPVMLLARCPVHDSPVRKGCKGCDGLTDRTGRRFLTRCDGYCSELLNPDCLWYSDKLGTLNCDFYTLLFDRESGDEVQTVIDMYRNGNPPPEQKTRGLYIRGVE